MKRIGKYEIIGEIGQGGMGMIYRARDAVIGREVAIKVIQERALNVPEVRERFYREAQAAGRLAHENVMVIHDIGEHEGAPYIVMEYLRGTDLRKLLDGAAPLTLDEKLQIAVQICEGLQYAHEHGIVHRDIKPDNIRILRGHRVKIMDFGIARLIDDQQTLTNASIGTPRYMSPEQVKGARVDHRSDIFSFGVVFYELLSGTNPFSGDHVTTVIYKILHEQPEPVHVAGTRMESDLQQIVARCLEKDPDKRYQEFGAVLRDLSAAMATRDWSTRTMPLPPSAVEAGEAKKRKQGDATQARDAGEKGRASRGVLVGAVVAVAVLALVAVYWGLNREGSTTPGSTTSADPAVPLATSNREPARERASGPLDASGGEETESAELAGGSLPDEVVPTEAEPPRTDATTTSSPPREETRTSPPVRREERADESPDSRAEELAEAERRDAAERERIESDRRKAAEEAARLELLERQMQAATQARTQLIQAKESVDARHQSVREYADARTLEDRGAAAFQSADYGDALAHFQSATNLYRELASRPVGPSPEALAEQAVNGLALRLKDGFEAADLAGLRRLTPFFDSWQSYFDVAHSISARVSYNELQVRGESATVQMLIELSYLDNKNRRQRTTLRQLWMLEETGDSWTVSDVQAL